MEKPQESPEEEQPDLVSDQGNLTLKNLYHNMKF